MSDVFIPPWIEPEEEQEKPIDDSVAFRHAFAPGIVQRNEYGGLRPQLSRKHTVRAEERAGLIAALRATRGSSKTLRTTLAQQIRGSLAATEMLSNTTFPGNSTTGWSASNATNLTISCNDRVLRATRNDITSSHTVRAPSFTATAYVPYVFRAMILAGRGPLTASLRLGTTAGDNDIATGATFTSQGLQTLVGVFPAGSAHASILDGITGRTAGDYYEVPWASVSQCPIVDNGPNLLLRSDELDNASWTKSNCSVTANLGGVTAPDGTTSVVDAIVENTANSSHFIVQSAAVSSAAADYSFGVALRADTRTWAQIVLTEDSGSTTASVYVNLSTGALGTTGLGANWSNLRTYTPVSLGNGWYAVWIVARKTNSATSVSGRIGLATADLTNTYTGDGSSRIFAWRATLAQSGVPTRLAQTTSSALSSGTAQTGSGIYVKGLTASTNGLLLPQDPFEINAELKFTGAPLNSNAAQLGYLQFEPPLVESPSDGDAVIVLDPMGRYMVSNLSIGNEFGVQSRVSYDIEHVYDP